MEVFQTLAGAQALIEDAERGGVLDAVAQRTFQVWAEFEVECEEIGHESMLGGVRGVVRGRGTGGGAGRSRTSGRGRVRVTIGLGPVGRGTEAAIRRTRGDPVSCEKSVNLVPSGSFRDIRLLLPILTGQELYSSRLVVLPNSALRGVGLKAE